MVIWFCATGTTLGHVILEIGQNGPRSVTELGLTLRIAQENNRITIVLGPASNMSKAILGL